MNELTKKKLLKIISKMQKDSYYNDRVICKNKKLIVDSFKDEFISEIIQLDVEENKKFRFLNAVHRCFIENLEDHFIPSMLYEKDGQSCLHLIVEKKLSVNFLLSYILLIITTCHAERIPNKTVTNYLNLRSLTNDNSTFINMLMKDVANEKNFDFAKNYANLNDIFVFFNKQNYNYNFLLPDIDGKNLCDYIDTINNSHLSRSFYKNNTDALAYSLKDNDNKNKKILDDIFDGFWKIDSEETLLRNYLNSYRTFEDDNYSYDFSDFARGFGNILKHIERGHISVNDLFHLVITNLKNKDPELLIEILEECIKNGYDINGHKGLMNDIFGFYNDESAFLIYKFLYKNGFNSYKSYMSFTDKIINKELSSEFIELYHSQIFIESLKENIIEKGLRFNFEFYDVNNENEVNEFYNFLKNAKMIAEIDEYYDLSEKSANIIIEEFNKSMVKQNNEVTSVDVLNAIKKIIIDGKEKQIRNIETYKQKLLEKSNYLL